MKPIHAHDVGVRTGKQLEMLVDPIDKGIDKDVGVNDHQRVEGEITQEPALFGGNVVLVLSEQGGFYPGKAATVRKGEFGGVLSAFEVHEAFKR